MRRLFNEFSMFGISVICAIISLTLMSEILNSSILKDEIILPYKRNDLGISLDYEVPDLSVDDFMVIKNKLNEGDNFNYKDYLSVHDTNGVDLRNFVTMEGEVNTKVPGLYDVKLILRWNAKTIIKLASFYVEKKL